MHSSEWDVLRKLVLVFFKNLIKIFRWKEADVSNCFIDEKIDSHLNSYKAILVNGVKLSVFNGMLSVL